MLECTTQHSHHDADTPTLGVVIRWRVSVSNTVAPHKLTSSRNQTECDFDFALQHFGIVDLFGGSVSGRCYQKSDRRAWECRASHSTVAHSECRGACVPRHSRQQASDSRVAVSRVWTARRISDSILERRNLCKANAVRLQRRKLGSWSAFRRRRDRTAGLALERTCRPRTMPCRATTLRRSRANAFLAKTRRMNCVVMSDVTNSNWRWKNAR